MVAGPKVSVLGVAGGPNVAPAQTGQRRLELLCQRPPRAMGLLSRTHLGAGRGFRTHEKIVLGVSWASTFILIAVKLLWDILDKSWLHWGITATLSLEGTLFLEKVFEEKY